MGNFGDHMWGDSKIAGKTDDGIRIVNVWASRELFDKFAETQAAIIKEIGVNPASLEMQFLDVHNYLSGTGWRG